MDIEQIKQKNLIDPNKLTDLRKVATDVVRKRYFNFIDEKTGVSQKVDFIFKGSNKRVFKKSFTLMPENFSIKAQRTSGPAL